MALSEKIPSAYLEPAEHARRKARYFHDSRRTTDQPESEGYSWDDAQMFRDLERAEANLRKAHALLERISSRASTRSFNAGDLEEALEQIQWLAHDALEAIGQ